MSLYSLAALIQEAHASERRTPSSVTFNGRRASPADHIDGAKSCQGAASRVRASCVRSGHSQLATRSPHSDWSEPIDVRTGSDGMRSASRGFFLNVCKRDARCETERGSHLQVLIRVTSRGLPVSRSRALKVAFQHATKLARFWRRAATHWPAIENTSSQFEDTSRLVY